MCEMTQSEALREVITFIDGTRNYRIGSFEFDHSQEPADVYVNCVRGIKNKIIYRFKAEHVNEKGLNILKNDGVSMIDWGGRLCLETDFDPEGNPVNATIEDNAGIKIACSALFVGCSKYSGGTAKTEKVTGYASASGLAPYDKFSDTLLTVGQYCYRINTDRIDFFFYFVDKTVEIEFNDNSITMICGEKRLDAIALEVCDAVSPEDAGLTQEQADELYDKIAKTSPCLQ